MDHYETERASFSLNDDYVDGSSSPFDHHSSSSFSRMTIPWSLSRILMMTMLASYLAMFLGSPMIVVRSQPIATMEFHRPYDHRSAMNTLKELDKYYSQLARPRFGKRAESNNPQSIMLASHNVPNYWDGIGAVADVEGLPTLSNTNDDGLLLSNGPYRWLMINRQQPLTKLTQNYLLEILADSVERRRQNSLEAKQPEKRHQQEVKQTV